jgi:predicted transport protein
MSGKSIKGRQEWLERSGPSITFEDHFAYTDADRQPLLRQIRQYIISLDDRLRRGETVTARQRIAYKIPGDKNFIEIKVQRADILIRLIETNVQDHRKMVRKIPESHGWGDLKDEYRISDSVDAEYALQFIEAAYRIVAGRN